MSHPFATIEKDTMTGQWAVVTRDSYESSMGWTAVKGSSALCLDVAKALKKHGYTIFLKPTREELEAWRNACRQQERERLAAQFGDALDDDADAVVAPENACPSCGERNADKLLWLDNIVNCTACGMRYQPGARGDDGQPH